MKVYAGMITFTLIVNTISGCSRDKEAESDRISDKLKALERSSYRSVIREGINPTGSYRFKYLNEEGLNNLSRDEAFAVLKAAMNKECRGNVESQHQLQLCYSICKIMLERFPLRGKRVLMEAYNGSKGEEIRRIALLVLAERGHVDIAAEVVEGLRGEKHQAILQSIDYSLHELTGHPLYRQKVGDVDLDWKALYVYWKIRVVPKQPNNRDGSAISVENRTLDAR